jgi:hypothetical protein
MSEEKKEGHFKRNKGKYLLGLAAAGTLAAGAGGYHLGKTDAIEDIDSKFVKTRNQIYSDTRLPEGLKDEVEKAISYVKVEPGKIMEKLPEKVQDKIDVYKKIWNDK